GCAGEYFLKDRTFAQRRFLRLAPPCRVRGTRGCCGSGGWFQAYPEVCSIHATSSAKLVDDPEDIACRKCEPEVIIPLGAIVGTDRDRQPAPDQAKQLAAKIGHHCAAVSRIERGLNLDQASELVRS